ncbi:MAG: DDE-type integrase/transposase/recombinase [Burkholderiales bacterium]|nr:DDE-type integrase/transposase/recombinase [Burkholderiales bacterium]
MMTWVSVPQLVGLPGLPTSDPRCRDFLQRANATSRARSARGGGLEYLVTDLPEETQQALAAQAAGAVKPATDAINGGKAAKRSAQVQSCADAMARYGVQLESRGAFDPRTNPRLDLFQRFEAYHRARGTAVWPCITEFCALWDAGQIDALDSTKAAYSVMPAKTLDKWYRAWRVNGVEALLERKPRKDKGQTALSRDPVMHEAFIGALAGIHDPTARQVRRVMALRLGDAAPPEGTIKRWLRDFKGANKVALLRFKNPDAFKNKYRVAHGSNSESLTAPNQRWELDSTITDCMLIDPATGEIRRHAIISCIDVYTRRVKFLVSRTSSSNAIKALVRRCIMDWGKPEAVKTDNGKDYLAHDFEFALQALQIGHQLSTPFSPEQKGHIERVQGTMLHDLFPMLAGFVGHSVAERKAIDSALSFAERFGKKNAVIEFHLPPEQLQNIIDSWVDEYHQRDHSALGCSPAAMAQATTTHITRIDERALDLLLMQVAGSGTRTVTKRGISFPEGWYAAPELAAANVMGTLVRCRQDVDDLGVMHVFNLDGIFICKALNHALLGINKAELSAKSRIVENETIAPFQQAMQKAKRSGIVAKAVDRIYGEREAAAADAAPNVTRLQPRVVMEATAAVAALVASRDTSAQDAARAQVRAAMEEDVPVVRPLTEKQLYSAWVRLQARVAGGEPVSPRELERMRSYESTAEFQGWHQLHQGTDPLAESTG